VNWVGAVSCYSNASTNNGTITYQLCACIVLCIVDKKYSLADNVIAVALLQCQFYNAAVPAGVVGVAVGTAVAAESLYTCIYSIYTLGSK
jgi:hypothetical protein